MARARTGGRVKATLDGRRFRNDSHSAISAIRSGGGWGRSVLSCREVGKWHNTNDNQPNLHDAHISTPFVYCDSDVVAAQPLKPGPPPTPQVGAQVDARLHGGGERLRPLELIQPIPKGMEQIDGRLAQPQQRPRQAQPRAHLQHHGQAHAQRRTCAARLISPRRRRASVRRAESRAWSQE